MRPLLQIATLCYLLLINSALLSAQSTSCAPPTIQNQCNSQDVDQSGSTGEILPNTALNPIDLFSGNKYLREVDLYPHPEAPDIEVVRHYNSMSHHYGALGGQWNLSYNSRLLLTKNRTVLQQANGTNRHLNTAQGRLEAQGLGHIWHYHNGDKWHFNQSGWLIQIQRYKQPPLVIERSEQNLITHISQNNHQLHLHYKTISGRAYLTHISTTQGDIHYKYAPQAQSVLYVLNEAHYPDQRRVYYHYEPHYQNQNPWALTGKSIQQSSTANIYRVRSWVYEPSGKAIFAMGAQPHQWVRLHYPNALHPAQTRLESANGMRYVDFNAPNSRHIKAVHGAPCWACPPSVKRTATQTTFDNFTVGHSPAPQMHIQHIKGEFDGWPGLQLHYDLEGRLTAWENTIQQRTELYYQNGKAQRMVFANGDQQLVHYNTQQQVVGIDYSSKSAHSLKTTLHRPSPRHLHIHHPHETEQLHVNATGQILERHIQRNLQTPSGPINWHYNEGFSYDQDNPEQLLRHQLPEGGALLYQWSEQGQLQGIEWEDKTGKNHPIVKTIKHQNGHGYEYGNGLQQLQSQINNTKTIRLQDGESKQLWWQQQLTLTNGLVTAMEQQFPIIHHYNLSNNNNNNNNNYYFYNQKKQLVIENNDQKTPHFYIWDKAGGLQAHNQSTTPQVQRDDSGLIQNWQHKENNYILGYNAMRRLDVVHKSEKTVQKNSHNAAGFRIYAQHYPQATQQFFLYDSKRIIAEYNIDLYAKAPIHGPHPVSRRYVYLGSQPVGLIDYSINPTGELLVMHSDHLGAVHIISDTSKKLRWAAVYDAFGSATPLADNLAFSFNLRRDGQYYDMSTGWHDNLLRVYLPQQGHYLEPDPLGPNHSSQLLGYTQQQPLNHTDPWGLILFSFDGTRYDQSSGGVIYLLHRAAQDDSYYAPGPGNPENVDWDAAVAYTTDKIVDQQWTTFVNHMHYVQAQMPTTTIPIDIIGFSRGGAIALHFANQIMKHTNNGLFSYKDRYGDQVRACIQPRFMGLLDNVAQMGIMGIKNYQYDFTVSPAWQWVVHGVAMHEYRHLFPLHTIGTGSNKQEIGLVGAHGDLGGGYPMVDDHDLRPLSDVALQWILWNARAQGMQFGELGLKKHGDYAYMHDESPMLEFDRTIRNHIYSPDNFISNRQSFHPVYGEKARRQTKPFIDYKLKSEEKKDNRAAKVDLNAYYRWLDQTINWSPE